MKRSWYQDKLLIIKRIRKSKKNNYNDLRNLVKIGKFLDNQSNI